MKFQITARKPRNPLVAAARLRVAGAHGPSASASRLQARRSLQRELGDLRDADRRRPSP
jgi:hypothetical protein